MLFFKCVTEVFAMFILTSKKHTSKETTIFVMVQAEENFRSIRSRGTRPM